MTIKTRLTVAAVVATLAPLWAHAVPIAEGTANLDTELTFQLFDVNATGYDNLTLAFAAIGGGTIDACGDFDIADCLTAGIDGQATSLAGLSITNDWQSFGPISLDVADSVFALSFDARITGDDEDMIVTWQIDGEAIVYGEQPGRVAVPEPGILGLLGLGLAGFGFSRRRKG